VTLNNQYTFRIANKQDKKNILRFYKSQHYSARFIGHDHCYLILLNDKIIGSVIISQITADNHQHFLHALVIEVQYQKQKLASKLLKEVMLHHKKIVCFADVSFSPFYFANKFKKVPLIKIDNTLTEQLSARFTRYSKKSPSLKIFISED